MERLQVIRTLLCQVGEAEEILVIHHQTYKCSIVTWGQSQAIQALDQKNDSAKNPPHISHYWFGANVFLLAAHLIIYQPLFRI